MLSQTILIASAAGIFGIVIGIFSGAMFTGRRMRQRVEEVGAELTRLQKVAETKLMEDDPNLPDLLRNLNTAVEQTYRAIDALDNQAQLTKMKTEGGREIIASSRHIMRMMEDMGASLPEGALTKPTRTINAAPVAAKAEPIAAKDEPNLR